MDIAKGKIGGKIGVFDSGFGGLSILKEIIKDMPQYNYVYLGDTARAPYGNRTQKEIYKFTREGIDFLFAQGASLVILACNSASSEALRKIQQEYLPKYHKNKKVIGVIVPAAEDAVAKTKNNKIAVIGTEATISSHAFRKEIKKLNAGIKVFEMATPLLAPIVEAGKDKSQKTEILIKKYLDKALSQKPDTLILGCTHYGILERQIKKYTKGVRLISEGKVVSNKLRIYLSWHKEVKKVLDKNGRCEFFTTASKERFDKLGSRFFWKKISSKTVRLL